MMTTRSKQPSNALIAGGGAGTSLGTLIELIAAAAGAPLPPGAGSAITGVIGMLVAYFTRGGRKGEPQ